jgi:AAA15 family ATPase/GTPase
MTGPHAGAPEGWPDSRPSPQEGIVPELAPAGQPLGVVSRPSGYRMITSLEIENFRPFKKAELSNLKRINIVVGDNASGKTAFLEALFLASASNPQIPITLRQWRGLEAAQGTTTTDLWESLWNNLFNEFDRNRVIGIQLHGSENDSRSLSMYFQKEAEVTLPLKQNGGGATELKPSTGIYQPFVFHWKSPDAADIVLTMRSTAGGLQVQGVMHESNLRSAFIPAHAQTSNQFTAVLFSNLSKQNKETDFVAALKMQFPKLQKISVELEAGASALFVSVPWLKQKIPLALFSNAASNLASILLNIASSGRGIVCIDEIENGFHYSRYESVWKQTYDFADVYETQIFASTHSLECLKAVLPTMKKHPADFAVVQLKQNNGVSEPFVVPEKDAFAAIENDIELRGSH